MLPLPTCHSAADAIMALPAELKLLDEDGNENAHVGKRVRLASDPPSSAADPALPLLSPDSDPRTASDPLPSPSPPVLSAPLSMP